MQSSHLIKQEIFFSTITTPLLQCFQLCEINRAHSNKVEAKTTAEFCFHPESVLLESVLNHKPNDCIKRVTIRHIWNSLPPFAHYQRQKLPPNTFASSISFIPEQHSLFSCVHLRPFLPPENSSLLYKFFHLFSIASSHLLDCFLAGFLVFFLMLVVCV